MPGVTDKPVKAVASYNVNSLIPYQFPQFVQSRTFKIQQQDWTNCNATHD